MQAQLELTFHMVDLWSIVEHFINCLGNRLHLMMGASTLHLKN